LPKLTKNFSIKKAHNTQRLLSSKLILEDRLPQNIQTVCGVDVSYVGNIGISAAIVEDYNSLNLLETKIAAYEVKFPYVSTLFAFREIPPALAAIRKLELNPDIFLVDAHGYAHPYRCGLASHLGLTLRKPTIGIAKNRLIGETMVKDGKTLLVDKGEVIGQVIATKAGSKPIYVSVGHKVSLETAAEIARHCSKNRIPEPLLKAHNLANKQIKLLAKESKVNI
jgi:deoxyribonuclease V